jgi:hypothetical protein
MVEVLFDSDIDKAKHIHGDSGSGAVVIEAARKSGFSVKDLRKALKNSRKSSE